MRIKGPPRPGSAGGTSKVGKTSKAGKTAAASAVKFDQLVDNEEDHQKRAQRVRNALMEELADMAAEIAAGSTSKEEASRRFVGLVIKERYGAANTGKGVGQMEDSIADMVEADPNFVNRLHRQLMRMGNN
jgi:hypothetical protein